MKLHRVNARLAWVGALVLAAVAVTAGVAILVSAAGAAPELMARIGPTPLPAPIHKDYGTFDDALAALLRSATVLAPHSCRNLTVFPVTVSSVADFGPVLTMDEALNRGLVTIEEVGSGSVNEVVAVNRSDSYVFMMASEMIGGAKQDRTLSEDLLLAPRSRAKIPVFCVEAHRWTAGAPGARFRSMNITAPMSVRKTVRLKQDQSEVWAEVSREQMRLAAPSSTGALKSVYESETVQRDLDPYLSGLGNIPTAAPNVIGAVVAKGSTIVAADLFYRPDLFRRLWPSLLRSYAADALGERRAGTGVTVRDAERFLGRLWDARRSREETPGAGYVVRLHGAGVNASALVFKRSVVHLDVFPGVEPLPQPLRERPMNLDYRRQRLEHGAQ